MNNRKGGNGSRMRLAAVWPAVVVALLMAWSGQTALAQGARLDLSRLDKLASKATKVKSVNLDGSMLKQVGKSNLGLAGPAGQFKDMAGHLQGVYVRKYEFDKPGEYSKADVENLMKQLQSKGWSPMVRDVDKKTGEIKGVYMFTKDGETEGMAVIKAEPKELSVVNIVGPINIGELSGLGGHHGGSKPELQRRKPSTPNSGSK